MDEREYVKKVARKAVRSGADAGFVAYLVENVLGRMEMGRSMDCDEYRALLVQARLPA